MKTTPTGRIYAPLDPILLGCADGLTAAHYIEPDGQGDDEPTAIQQEPNWKEGA